MDGTFTKEFVKSIMPSAMLDVLSIGVTSVLIAKLIGIENRYHDKIDAFHMINYDFEKLMKTLGFEYIEFVTKYTGWKGSRIDFTFDTLVGQLKEISNNLSQYIDADFVKTGYIQNGIRVNKTPSHTHQAVINDEVSYMTMVSNFTDGAIDNLDKFLQRYISVLPLDLKKQIFIVDEQLKSRLFHPMDISVTKDFPKEFFLDGHKKFSKDLYLLSTYFDDLKNKKQLSWKYKFREILSKGNLSLGLVLLMDIYIIIEIIF
ncbi:hypothetical protein ACFVP8_06480 [Viridibacillus arvi]|uniref:hypothetical protein n=1 Tax=Viridibacillus arvi TaxID=263475 RepID=UPI00369FC4BB